MRMYVMFAFRWYTCDPKDWKGEVHFAFNCVTGDFIEFDTDEPFPGNSEDMRFVTEIEPLTTLSQHVYEDMNLSIFESDHDKIGKALVADAGFDIKRILRVPPTEGELVFVYEFNGGVTDSTPDGPGEGWMDLKYIGELNSLKIQA